MAELYGYARYGGLKDWRIEGKPAESLEGRVTQSLIRGNLFSSEPNWADRYHPSLYIEIDSLRGVDIIIQGVTFRLEIGEMVRVHSFRGFDERYAAHLGSNSLEGQVGRQKIVVDGLEVLDPSGKTKFYYTQYSDYVFRDS